MTAISNIKSEVRELKAYTLKRQDCQIKLNQNESPADMPSDLKELILERVQQKPWNRYPDFHPQDVLERLGADHGLCSRSVLIGNGSNELLQAIFQACVGPGQTVSIPCPTFTLYKTMIAANGGSTDLVHLDSDLQYDAALYLSRAALKDRHLVICNPNNPTGSWLSPEVISQLCESTPRLVIVDEAYIEFAETPGCASLIAKHSNLIVLRTYSKAMGLAGVRFGYALGSPELMDEVGKIKLPYNVGHFGLEVIRAALDSKQYTAALADQIIKERQRVFRELDGMGVEAVPSKANFILFRHQTSAILWQNLVQRGILIRDVSHYPRLSGCLRVTIGSRADNDAFLNAMRDILKELS